MNAEYPSVSELQKLMDHIEKYKINKWIIGALSLEATNCDSIDWGHERSRLCLASKSSNELRKKSCYVEESMFPKE